jgi:hypothetical protein
MTTHVRRIICFVVYAAMCIGGAALVAVQLFMSPVIVKHVFAGAAVLMGLGGYLLWEDFLRSKPSY